MIRARILGIATFLFALALVAQASPDTTEEFHKIFTLAQGAPVRVSNTSGKVEVRSWDQPYADVRAVKHSHHGRAELDRVTFEIISTNGALDIRTVYDCSRGHSRENEGFFSHIFGKIHFGSQAWVDYTIRIPRAASLERVKTSSGDIEVWDVRGDFSLETSSGDVELTGAEGHIDAHSSSGDITIRDSRGTVSIESSSGDIRGENSTVSNAKTSSGDVRLRKVRGNMTIRTSSGEIQVEGTDGTVEAHSRSGDIWLEGFILRGATSSSGDIHIRAAGLADSVCLGSHSGDITVDIPDGVNAEMVMVTSSGELINRSGQNITATVITRKKIAGRLGSGGAPFIVRTSSGNVELK